ncbi:MAG TPA: amidohydrolase family protein [Verrucomicrobiae bacterium]|nr:amidohydrolase family protein [Verrucomicrobiae bacterium]
MRPILLRAVRLIDPASSSDLARTDCLIVDGRIAAVGPSLAAPADCEVWHHQGSVLAPAFIDLHAHLRTPGPSHTETVASGTAAAARGGFATVCAMANTDPPLDQPRRLADLGTHYALAGSVTVRQFAACTRGLAGREPVEVEAMADAGAVGFSDDGRNAMAPAVLAELLRRAIRCQRVVAIHPEDEAVLAAANLGDPGGPSDWPRRPPEAELAAVTTALATLAATPGARLHLQHCSTAAVLPVIRAARRAGLGVTAEVTPHHLALTSPAGPASPAGGAARCNPPLRGAADRGALWAALLDGTVDAVATDHAPHEPSPAESGARPSAGFSGLETALGVLLALPDAARALPRLVAALTVGPWRVLGEAAGLPCPSLRPGAPADCVWFDPTGVWSPAAEPQAWRSGGRNTPFWTAALGGRVLATLRGGRPVHRWSPPPGTESGTGPGEPARDPASATAPRRG